jgi:DNA-binding SARP family transcriptional activator
VLEAQSEPIEMQPRHVTPNRTTDIGDDGHDAIDDDLDEVDVAPDMALSKQPPVMPALALRVLGRVELGLHDDGADRDLTSALTRKQREVLVYLAVHPDGARRDALNDAIWPGSPISRPFNSFHNALSTLRRALHQTTNGRISEIIVHDGDRYRLDTSIVTTDYGRIQAALNARSSTSDSERMDALHHAVALYTGHLAEDVTSDWIEAYREATRRDVLDALGILIRAHSKTNPNTLLALLEKLRTLDPSNEGIYRDIIRTQARLNQHDAIGRTFTLLATTLDELDQRPSQETINLAQFLQRHGITNRPPATGGAAAS